MSGAEKSHGLGETQSKWIIDKLVKTKFGEKSPHPGRQDVGMSL